MKGRIVVVAAIVAAAVPGWAGADKTSGLPRTPTVADLLDARHATLTAPVAAGGAGLIAAPVGVDFDSFRAPDLDGDGKTDILLARDDPGTDSVAYRVLSGAGGEVKWNFATRISAYIGFPDTDGDGIAEVLVVETDDTAVTQSVFVASAGAGVTRTSLTLYDGLDGARRWRREEAGSIAFAGTGFGAAVLHLDGWFTSVSIAPDMLGEGGDDIVASFRSLRTVSVAGRPTTNARLESRTYSGTDGSQGGLVVFDVSDGATIPVVIADASGDGLADVAGIDAALGERTVVVYEADGTRAWSSPMEPRPEVPVLLPFDDTGFAAIVTSVNEALIRWEWIADGFFPGGTGWTASGTGRPTILAGGDSNGDGVGDIQFLTSASHPRWNSAKVWTVSGADGDTLWLRQHQHDLPQGWFGWLNVCLCGGDLDGDGVSDIVVDQEQRNAYGPEREIALQAWRGKDGLSLWAHTPASRDEAPIVVSGDLDGDGPEDLGRFSWGTKGSDTLTFQGLRGSNLEPMWSGAVAGVGEGASVWGYAADVAGDDAAEMIVHVYGGGGGGGTIRAVVAVGPNGESWRVSA